MQIEGSIWNAEEGRASDENKTGWSQAPSTAYFQGFSVDGCNLKDGDTRKCYSAKVWWNKN
ncbi:hypothetical protein SLEP1_g17496 [Rubroshorea leprosula]|uniref:Uncharacterized protein n=1 Tax=Rubroshorea leprosula TaxID=152421 RepID=A0AAV5J219_9ROSI|nr:hypothetical protein SLEP1_g17496 [Rubroshorea leprosula]